MKISVAISIVRFENTLEKSPSGRMGQNWIKFFRNTCAHEAKYIEDDDKTNERHAYPILILKNYEIFLNLSVVYEFGFDIEIATIWYASVLNNKCVSTA